MSQSSNETSPEPLPASPAPAYERPVLVPLGNLRDLLGKSGTRNDMPGPHPRRK